MDFGDYFHDFVGRLQSTPPDAKRCDDARELADWFLKFSIACRATLPTSEPS
jgi:hypothetical protein